MANFTKLNGYDVKDAIAIHTYDTVASFKADTKLKVNDHIETKGYNTTGDGGRATYIIVDDETLIDDGGSVHELSNGLFAVLLSDGYVTPEQFGAKGDGVTDDQDAINNALQYNVSTVRFGKGKTYLVRGYETGQSEGDQPSDLSAQTGIVIPSNKIVDLNYSTVKLIPNNRKNYNIFTIKTASNVILKNGNIVGDVGEHVDNGGQWGYGVSLRFAKNVTLENLYCTKCWGDGINLNNNGDHSDFNIDVTINNCVCDDNRRQGMSIENGKHITVRDSRFINTGYTAYDLPAAGVDVEPLGDSTYDITFDGCDFSTNRNDGLTINGDNIDTIKVINCLFNNNNATDSDTIFFVNRASNVSISNCKYQNTTDNYKFIYLASKNGVEFSDNRLLDVHLHIFPSPSNVEHTDVIANNVFDITKESSYNSIIETAGSGTSTSGNEVVIYNNVFNNSNNNTNFNVRYYIEIILNKGYKKAYIKDNIFNFGRRAISVGTSAIIENNNFIGQFNFPIHIDDSTSTLENQTLSICNNDFELTGYYTGANHVIQSQTNVPTVLTNNTYFTKVLNNSNSITSTYAPTRWYDNEPSVLVNVNNNIVANGS